MTWLKSTHIRIIYASQYHYITLHYFTMPLTPDLTSGESTKSYSSFICELKQAEFSAVFQKYQCTNSQAFISIDNFSSSQWINLPWPLHNMAWRVVVWRREPHSLFEPRRWRTTGRFLSPSWERGGGWPILAWPHWWVHRCWLGWCGQFE